jgi:23S rRNA U2552 (ribose-2'-O)-methylase RlmE/FtsJ
MASFLVSLIELCLTLLVCVTSKSPRATESGDLIDLFKAHTGMISDKWEGYLHVYNREFGIYREKAANSPRGVRIMEVGVMNGGSLQLWRQFFGPRSEVVGVDLNPRVCDIDFGVGIEVYCFNALNVDRFVYELSGKKQDIIIDDGSHEVGDITATFTFLFEHFLLPGGIYIVEDIHMMYINYTDSSPMNFFMALVAPLNIFHVTRSSPFRRLSSTEVYFAKWVEAVRFEDGMIIVHKRARPRFREQLRVITGKLNTVSDDESVAEQQAKGHFDNTQRMQRRRMQLPPLSAGAQDSETVSRTREAAALREDPSRPLSKLLNTQLLYEPVDMDTPFTFHYGLQDMNSLRARTALKRRMEAFCDAYDLWYQNVWCVDQLFEVIEKDSVDRSTAYQHQRRDGDR